MSFSLACDDGTTPTVLRIEGTDSDVTWADLWDYDGGGGNGAVTGDANGDAVVSDFMDEVVENNVYQITKDVEIGDGANSLTFNSKDEMVYFVDDVHPEVKTAATLNLGEKQGDWGTKGSMWSFGETDDNWEFADGGTINVYASRLHNRKAARVYFNTGAITILNSILSGDYANLSDWKNHYRVNAAMTVEMKDTIVTDTAYLRMQDPEPTVDNLHLHYNGTGLNATINNAENIDMIISNCKFTENDTDIIANNFGAGDFNVQVRDMNGYLAAADLDIGDSNISVQEEYTCNIHVVDEDGNDLESVTVTCENQSDAEVFSASTDAGGDITEQVIPYKKWEGTSETEIAYSPHKFTFSKDGYRTLVIESVTINSTIDWEVTLQNPRYARSRVQNPARLSITR